MAEQFYVEGDKLNPRFHMGVYQVTLNDNSCVQDDNKNVMTSQLDDCSILCDETNLNGNFSEYMPYNEVDLTECDDSFNYSEYVVDNSSALCIESSSCQDLTGEDIPNIDELIKLVINQTMCSEAAARKALISCEGDIICSILRVTD